MAETEGKNRKVYIDFLKIVSIYLILFNHTSILGSTIFIVRQESPFFSSTCLTVFL